MLSLRRLFATASVPAKALQAEIPVAAFGEIVKIPKKGTPPPRPKPKRPVPEHVKR
jgi:hypothetical protein